MKMLFSFFQSKRFLSLTYPILIVIAIPALLVINTLWNLKSFNRDANFIVRHMAASLADSIKPQVSSSLENKDELKSVLTSAQQSNTDVLDVSVLSKNPPSDTSQDLPEYHIVASSNSETNDIEFLSDTTLNNFALSTGNSYAGLSYSPTLQKNVWKVSVPLDQPEQGSVLSLIISTDTVEQILDRTSKDSLILLSFTLVITIALLINHLIFYKRSLRTQQLEELGKLKDEFISMASHELRAPVTGLVGYLELLKDKLKGKMSADMQEDFSTLGMLTTNLQKLINDLLEVSRIEQNRIKISKSQTDPNKLIHDTITKFTPMANQKGLKLTFNSAQALPQISSDPDRMEQILNNLISNAIKYSLKGEVNITTKLKAKEIEISVKDSGIGIPPEEMDNLFEKFHRVKDKQTEEVNGTGLGLWITKKLAEALGGTVSAQSIYGTGSTFTLTLPVS